MKLPSGLIRKNRPCLRTLARMVVFDTGPDYLNTMGIPLLQGRFFTAEDNTNSACVGVIDTVLAQTYFPGKNPVGQDHDVWMACRSLGSVRDCRSCGARQPLGIGRAGRRTRKRRVTIPCCKPRTSCGRWHIPI